MLFSEMVLQNLAKPRTKSGKIDKRYKSAQFVNKDGTRDKRTTLQTSTQKKSSKSSTSKKVSKSSSNKRSESPCTCPRCVWAHQNC